jgi:hypothetical protein
MGRTKRSRKIKSGNKMVWVAIRSQEVIHKAQIAAILAMCQSTISVIKYSSSKHLPKSLCDKQFEDANQKVKRVGILDETHKICNLYDGIESVLMAKPLKINNQV